MNVSQSLYDKLNFIDKSLVLLYQDVEADFVESNALKSGALLLIGFIIAALTLTLAGRYIERRIERLETNWLSGSDAFTATKVKKVAKEVFISIAVKKEEEPHITYKFLIDTKKRKNPIIQVKKQTSSEKERAVSPKAFKALQHHMKISTLLHSKRYEEYVLAEKKTYQQDVDGYTQLKTIYEVDPLTASAPFVGKEGAVEELTIASSNNQNETYALIYKVVKGKAVVQQVKGLEPTIDIKKEFPHARIVAILEGIDATYVQGAVV